MCPPRLCCLASQATAHRRKQNSLVIASHFTFYVTSSVSLPMSKTGIAGGWVRNGNWTTRIVSHKILDISVLEEENAFVSRECWSPWEVG